MEFRLKNDVQEPFNIFSLNQPWHFTIIIDYKWEWDIEVHAIGCVYVPHVNTIFVCNTYQIINTYVSRVLTK